MMRVWQKIYFMTLLLFLGLLNAGLFLAARFIFSYNMQQEQKQGETDCYFICQNLEHDFAMLEQSGRYKEQIIALVIEGYQDYYSTKSIDFFLEETDAYEAVEVSSNVTDGGGQMEVYVARNLTGNYQSYRIHYKKRLVDFEKIWQSIQQVFALISLVTSLLLCLLLYILMKNLLKPLDRLNESVAQIAAGNYGQQAYDGKHRRTKDEIGELSENVNKMAKTIQNQISALEEENAKKQQLMDNMAHELRTPLTSIYGFAEYLKCAKTTEEEEYEGLTYIMSESSRLAKMSETMLSMRFFETKAAQAEAIEMQSLASHVEKILSEKLKEKQLTLRENFNIEKICGEEELLINLFRNLLENAIRASRTGEDIIWNAMQSDEKLVFEIIDYGIGMEQEELSKITEAFYRVDKARARKDGGVGLGLSVASLIVKKMDGSMTFSSIPGEGTTVILQFPNKMIKSH